MEQVQILLLKGSKDDEDNKDEDSYVKFLEPTPTTRVPVLEFEAISDSVAEIEEFSFSAIIVTSTRAIWAISLSCSSSLKQRLCEVPWWVVGEASAKAAHDFGAKHVLGSDTGSAEILLEAIDSDVSKNVNIAYLCGNLRRPTIGAGLTKLGISFKEFVVYRTIPDMNVSLPQILPPTRRVCVFFSPSGVLAASKQLSKEDVIIAIGTTTEQSLCENGITVQATALMPTPEGLRAAFRSITFSDL
jgi:uroporphyrinogen-III synthase